MITPFANLATYQATTIVARPDHDLVVSAVEHPKDEVKPDTPFWVKTSAGISMYGLRAGYPYEETLMSMTANESKMYKLILDNYNFKTGLAVVDTKNLSASDKVALSRGYTELHKRNLVKRVKKFTYLINPDARIHSNLYVELLDLWSKTP